MIYVASPYSHPDKAVRDARFREVCAFVARMFRDGMTAFSPIAHSHSIAEIYGLPVEFEFWKRFNIDMLRRCDALWIVKMDGWKTSRGIADELELAVSMNLPVRWINSDDNLFQTEK
jgi:hypothetical protein